MRLPKRLRGVVLGLAILILGPIVATSFASNSRLVAARQASTPPSASSHSTRPLTAHEAVEVSAVHRLRQVATAVAPPPPPPPPVKAAVAVKPKPAAPRPPSPPAVVYPPGSIEAIITAAAQRHGVDPAWMIRTASCESGLRPNAYNPAGPYIGLFQFLPSTFRAHGGTNIYDPVQQSEIAASMFAAGNSNAWPVCSHR